MLDPAMLERQQHIYAFAQQNPAPGDTELEPNIYLQAGHTEPNDSGTIIELLQLDPLGGAFKDQPDIIIGGPWAAHIHGANWNPTPHLHLRTGTVIHQPANQTGYTIDPIPAEQVQWERRDGLAITTLAETYRWITRNQADPVNTGRWIDHLIRRDITTLAELNTITPNDTLDNMTATEYRQTFLDDVSRW